MGRSYLRLEKFQGKLCFQGKGNCSKFLNAKKYVNTMKNFRATLFFRSSASCSKILNDKKYTFNTVNSGHTLFFSASAKLLKNPERGKKFQYSVFRVYSLGGDQRRSKGGLKGLKPPLSNQNIDVYFLSFTPILQVEIGRIAEYSSAVPQGLATHLLTNQAVINFRDLRNIEAAFFIPAWFVLSSTTRTGCYRALPAWKQARHLNCQQCRLMCSLYVAKLRPSLCAHLDDMHQCYHF